MAYSRDTPRFGDAAMAKVTVFRRQSEPSERTLQAAQELGRRLSSTLFVVARSRTDAVFERYSEVRRRRPRRRWSCSGVGWVCLAAC